MVSEVSSVPLFHFICCIYVVVFHSVKIAVYCILYSLAYCLLIGRFISWSVISFFCVMACILVVHYDGFTDIKRHLTGNSVRIF